MTRQFIKYFVRGLHLEDLRPVSLSVSDESNVLSIVEDSRDLINAASSASTAAINLKVAYLPKNVAVKLNVKPFHNHPDWFAAIASHLEYPEETCKVLSLDLYGERDCDNVQFFIEHHPDQSEPFILLKEEQDHQEIIEYAGSNALENELTATSTSEYMMYPEFIYNGRGASGMGPPITIYEEVFADIADDLAHLEDLPDGNQDILDEIGDFANQSLQTYSSTLERESTLYHLIETLLGVEMIRNEDYSTYMDVKRHAVAKERDAIYLHVECKNELGLDGMERGALTMLKYIADPKYAPIRNTTCCPCIHVSIAGPYISFGGSILTDIYNFQPFTDYMFPGSYSYMASRTNQMAKVFSVFRSAANKLRDKYKGLEYYGPMRRDRSRLFPQPAYPADPNIQSLAFDTYFLPRGSYYSPIRRALFLAKFGGQRVMVKFSEKYSPDAHHAVAKAGLAPKLLFHTRLRGGVHMAVMEFIDGSDAKYEFSNRELPDDVVKQVKAAITILRDMNLVHGDVRRSNILIKKEQASEAAADVDPARHAYRAYLVDFDGAGLASVDRYTPFLNMFIYWPPGVRPGSLMEKEHDDVLLQRTIHPGDM